MKNIFQLLFFLSVTCIFTVSAQNTAQVQDFVNLGNRAVSKSTGRVERSIPLCSVNEFGFNIGVGLHYSSEGFKPAKRESEVGYNWFLNTGGAINRVVHGIEDERRDDRLPEDGYDPDNKIDRINMDGYYIGIQKHFPTKDQIELLNEELHTTIYDTIAKHLFAGPIDDPYELNPDEFQFNLGNGVSGKFYIDLDGSPKVIPNGPYHVKVDISGFSEQHAEDGLFDHRKPANSEIIMTLDNGYKYYFGGNYNYLQWYSDDLYLSKNRDTHPNGNAIRPVINTWNLARIVAPNGYETVYTYNDYDINYEIREDQTQTVDESISMMLKKEGVNIDETILDYSNWECQFTTPKKDFTYFVKKSTLKSIKINNSITINFTYKNNGNPRVTNDFGITIRGTFLDDRPGHLLDKIAINGAGITPSKSVEFDYDFFGEDRRPFLKSVTIGKEEPYTFEYQHTDNLPGYESLHRNQYGYYTIGPYSEFNNFFYGHRYGIYENIYDGSGQIVAKILKKTKDCYFYYNTQGELLSEDVPWDMPNNSNLEHYGLLHKITLPTKGSISFEYKNVGHGNNLEPIQIQKVNYDDGKGKISSKSYEIVPKAPSPLGDPPYGFIDQFLEFEDGQKRPFKTVREILPNGSSVYSLFSRRRTGISYETQKRNSDTILNFPFWDFKNSTYVEEGKILASLSFDAEGKPLSKIEYLYDIDFDPGNTRYDHYIPKLTTYKDGAKLNRIYTKPNFLRETRTYTFDPASTKRFYRERIGANWVYKTNFSADSYDDSDISLKGVSNSVFDVTYHKLKRSESYTDENQKRITTYTYPYEYNQSNTVYHKMVTNNILAGISQKTTLNDQGTIYALSSSISQFKEHNGFIVPDKSYQWIPSGTSMTTTSQLNIAQNGTVTIADPHNTGITTYTDYSDKGVPYGSFNNTGTSSYTIYNENDLNAIMTIDNISYIELSTIADISETSQFFMNHFGYTNFLEYLSALYKFGGQNPDNEIFLYLYNYNNGTSNPPPTGNFLEEVSTIAQLQERALRNLGKHLITNFPKTRYQAYGYLYNGLLSYELDSRNRKTSYEYDENYRLITTRDHEGNIINHTSYNTKK